MNQTTEVKDVERHISHTLVLRVINTVLLILQSIFLTRMLGPEGRGLLAKLQAAQNFFILFLGVGVAAALSHYIPSRKYEPQKILGVGFLVWVGSLISLFVIQLLFFFFPSIELIFPTGYATSFFEIYFFVAFALNFLQTLINAALWADTVSPSPTGSKFLRRYLGLACSVTIFCCISFFIETFL